MLRHLQKILIVLLLSKAYTAFADPSIRVDARFDSAQILIGDQIFFRVTIEQPNGIKVVFPNFKDSLAGKIEILKVFPLDTFKLKNGTLKIQQKYLITSFDSGSYLAGPFKFAINQNNTSDTLISDPVMLTVITIPIKDLTRIADIKKIIKLPLTLKELLPLMGITLLVLLLIAFGIYAYSRWKHNKPLFNFMQKPEEPAHIVAFRELNKIKDQKLWQQGLYKEYFSRITDVIRTYIESRYHVPAKENTTYEIYQTLNRIEEIDKQLIEELYRMLQLSDLVKFAKAEPLPDENINAWEVAYKFVDRTYIRPVVLDESDNSDSKELDNKDTTN
jgi:hypothetical protein